MAKLTAGDCASLPRPETLRFGRVVAANRRVRFHAILGGMALRDLPMGPGSWFNASPALFDIP